jgi:hypothetical protein
MGQRLENFTAGVACPCADSACFGYLLFRVNVEVKTLSFTKNVYLCCADSFL